MNGMGAILRNQIPEAVKKVEDENQILFISNDGVPVSTPNFVYIPNIEGPTGPTNLLGVNGDLQINGNCALLGNVGVGEINNGRFVEIAADSTNNAYIDFHSRDSFSEDYDTRILSNGGASGPGNGNMFFEANSVNFNCPVRFGSWSSIPMKIDYGQITGVSTTNQTGTQVFTTDMFTDAPYVQLTFQSTGRIIGSEVQIFVLTASCMQFEWQLYGTPPVDSKINWVAFGV